MCPSSRGKWGGLPSLFWKQTKSALILGKIALFTCFYGLNSHLKCSFKSIWRKNAKIFPCKALILYVVHKCLSKCTLINKKPVSKKPVLPWKIPGCVPVTLILTFHPSFHPNIWLFTNLPIYRKSIHDNVSLVFWKPKIFCLVLFWRRFKIVFTYKYLH